MEAQWKKQKRCFFRCYKLVTLDVDSGKYGESHGYPKYLQRIKDNEDEIKKFTLEDLYQASFGGKSDIVNTIYC